MVFRSEDNMIVKGTIINRSFNKKTKDSALFLVLIKCLFFFFFVCPNPIVESQSESPKVTYFFYMHMHFNNFSSTQSMVTEMLYPKL